MKMWVLFANDVLLPDIVEIYRNSIEFRGKQILNPNIDIIHKRPVRGTFFPFPFQKNKHAKKTFAVSWNIQKAFHLSSFIYSAFFESTSPCHYVDQCNSSNSCMLKVFILYWNKFTLSMRDGRYPGCFVAYWL